MGTDLICACCGGSLALQDAAPAPDGVDTRLWYHADFQACVRVTLADIAHATPFMRAMLGAPQEADHARD